VFILETVFLMSKQFFRLYNSQHILYRHTLCEEHIRTIMCGMENSNDIERVQKATVRTLLGNKFEYYEQAMEDINLQKLIERRNDFEI
jgi:hypothetical protein